MATSIQCPIPDNINPLSPTGFLFSVQKLPEMTYFCQSATIPDISLGQMQQGNPFVDSWLPGEKLEFGELNIRFLIDENMANYKAIFDWMQALGYPENNQQYSDYLQEQSSALSEVMKGYSDATLSVLNNSLNPVMNINYVDLFPTSLGSLEFVSTATDVQYFTGNAIFKYSYYTMTAA